LERKGIDPHTEAIVSSCLGWMYYERGETEQAINYLIRAAIRDLRSATKETTALRVLAGLLYERGDINRANNYVKLALQEANFYNARHRKIEIGAILPVIEQDRFDIMKNQRNVLIGFVSLVSILFILLLIATLVIYKQVKKLRAARRTIENRNLQLLQINDRLSETNNIKDEYIGYSFYLNSEYIEKMEGLYKMINRKIAARQFEDLRNSIKDSDLNRERNNMYASFDETFLKLFPDFIASYNELFRAEDRVKGDHEKNLTSEMRIFALIRLGIYETERIAKFLNYSVHTINTYKTRVKNKSLVSNEQFEAKIMEIASVTR
jgi:predicted Holliday junction resolvase-like endonuclease